MGCLYREYRGKYRRGLCDCPPHRRGIPHLQAIYHLAYPPLHDRDGYGLQRAILDDESGQVCESPLSPPDRGAYLRGIFYGNRYGYLYSHPEWSENLLNRLWADHRHHQD